jgi:hypothetical protein
MEEITPAGVERYLAGLFVSPDSTLRMEALPGSGTSDRVPSGACSGLADGGARRVLELGSRIRIPATGSRVV